MTDCSFVSNFHFQRAVSHCSNCLSSVDPLRLFKNVRSVISKKSLRLLYKHAVTVYCDLRTAEATTLL